jgi:hypothetical protein
MLRNLAAARTGSTSDSRSAASKRSSGSFSLPTTMWSSASAPRIGSSSDSLSAASKRTLGSVSYNCCAGFLRGWGTGIGARTSPLWRRQLASSHREGPRFNPDYYPADCGFASTTARERPTGTLLNVARLGTRNYVGAHAVHAATCLVTARLNKDIRRAGHWPELRQNALSAAAPRTCLFGSSRRAELGPDEDHPLPRRVASGLCKPS